MPSTTGHDALCPWPMVCYCTIIRRARADERARWTPPQPVTPGHAALCWCPTCITLKRYDCCDGTRYCGVCHARWSMADHCLTHADACRDASRDLPRGET